LRVWAQVRDRDAAESELRTAGVNAIGVRQWDEVVAVRRERGPVQTVEIPHPFGRRPSIYVPPWRVDGKLPAATSRAPFLGEHTEQVLREMQMRDQPGVDELLRAGLLLQHHPNEEAG
jgi:crotonobetainyl-CoA:carnitine CoA-transferase CaiB-like acyl-CoA transferase